MMHPPLPPLANDDILDGTFGDGGGGGEELMSAKALALNTTVEQPNTDGKASAMYKQRAFARAISLSVTSVTGRSD